MIEVDYRVEVLTIDKIRASEVTDARAVQELAQAIFKEGTWCTALPIEEETRLVMDGNHRLQVAKLLGLKLLPCVLLSYDDPRVSVSDWNSGEPLDRNRLLDMFQKHSVLPFKSTRHKFAPTLPLVTVPLNMLR